MALATEKLSIDLHRPLAGAMSDETRARPEDEDAELAEAQEAMALAEAGVKAAQAVHKAAVVRVQLASKEVQTPHIDVLSPSHGEPQAILPAT